MVTPCRPKLTYLCGVSIVHAPKAEFQPLVSGNHLIHYRVYRRSKGVDATLRTCFEEPFAREGDDATLDYATRDPTTTDLRIAQGLLERHTHSSDALHDSLRRAIREVEAHSVEAPILIGIEMDTGDISHILL